MSLSIVITTYNRARVVVSAIDSALRFVSELKQGEIVVVDDASTDDTEEVVKRRYLNEMRTGLIRFFKNAVNLGPTGAKNEGAMNTRGDWLIFLDSDDVLIPESAQEVMATIDSHAGCVLFFFRVRTEDGDVIGLPQASPVPMRLGVSQIALNGTSGECLPVVQSSAFKVFPFDRDLRGFEVISYFRLIRNFGEAIISPVIARVYSTNEWGDRISTRRAIRTRGNLLAKGYKRLLHEAWPLLGFQERAILCGKAYWHFFNYVIAKISNLWRVY